MSNSNRFTATNNPNKYFSETWDEEVTAQYLPEHIQGAGCFGKGTFVLTANGYKAIDLLTINDKILGYDKFGEVSFARITKIHKHTKNEFVDDLYYISCEAGVIWSKGITGNHAVFDAATNKHKLIMDFAVGDVLTDCYGNPIVITDINITAHDDLSDAFEVYNLTVEPQHTYICGNETTWIRVHNGGGGKDGVIPAGVEAPNTLQSSSIAYVLDLISYGPIVGINGGVDIQKGIYFNNTALKSPQGQANFTGYFLESGVYTPVTPYISATTGTPDQPALSGFSEVETTIYGDNRLVGYSSPVTITIPDTGKQAVRVTLNFANGLWSQNFTTGDINGAAVNFTIYTKSSSSSVWTPAATGPLSGKTTSAYMVDYIISAPAECLANPSLGWAIQIKRFDADDLVNMHTQSQTAFYVFSVTEIAYLTETYPNMALVGLQVPAITVNNSIPTRGYLVTGLIVQVPSNYDTVHRTYNGSISMAYFTGGIGHSYSGATNQSTSVGYWDKSFKWAWTDNPAWILYDLITNNVYGMGDYLGVTIDVDVWSFYEASLFNDCTTWNPSTQKYTKKLIPKGNATTISVTNVAVYGSTTTPAIVGYVTVPGHSVYVGDSVTISGVTGALSTVFNGTFGVTEVIDKNTIAINVSSTTSNGTSVNSGMILTDLSAAGYEHRFLFNMPITAQQDAWQLLQAIAGSMWAIVTVVNGKITLLQDRPKVVSRIFNNSNVLTGLFTYSGTEITTRTTAINVTFNDKNNLYRPKTISEWDETNVALYGYIPNDIVAVGCVDESQARRQARFALYTALYQPEICVFGISLNILDLAIGDLIATQDNAKVRPATQFISGRISSVTGIGTTSATFTLDRTITLLAGTYSFGVAAPDGYSILNNDGSTSVQSYIFSGTIASPTGSVNTSTITVSFASALPVCSTNYANAEFYAYCEASGDYADYWTVQSISETDRGQFNLTCISYNKNKWKQIEDSLAFTPMLVPSGLIQNQLPAPGTVSFLPVFTNNTTSVSNSLYISWLWDNSVIKDQVTFTVSWKVDYENWVTVKNLPLPNYEIKNAVPGVYTVSITATNIAGIISPQAQNSYNYYISSTNYKPLTVNAGSLQATNANVTGNSISKAVSVVGSTLITAQSLVASSTYIINSIGATVGYQTDFTLLGAASNIIGTQFVATGADTGTSQGTVKQIISNTSTWGDSYCFGTTGYNTPIAVRFAVNSITGECLVGLDKNITATSGVYNDPDVLKTNFQFGIYCVSGTLYTIENGVQSPATGNYGAYAITDVLEVVYTGTAINFTKNGVTFRTVSYSLPTGSNLYFNSVYYTPGIGISNFSLGTYATSTLSSILPPTNLVVTGTSGTVFSEKDLHISWTENPANTTAVIKTFNTGAGTGLANTNILPLNDVASLVIGQTITGNGVPLNTVISSISGNNLTLSSNLTVQANGSYSFSIPVSTLYAYILRIMSGSSVLKEFVVKPDTTGFGGSFVYSYGQNSVDHSGTPTRSVVVNVYAQDTLGNISSTYTTATFTNAQAGAVTSFTAMPILNAVSITIIPNTVDTDVAGFKIYRSLLSAFVKNATTEIYDGTSPSVSLPTPNNSNTYFYAVAEYDSFDKNSLVTSSEVSSISIGTTAIQWSLLNIVFTVASNVVSWTAGTIYKNGVAYAISAGSATWTSGVLYIYYPGSGPVLNYTNVTLTALSIGSYPIATYDTTYGLKGGDGTAFFSGSQLLAATVGTSQLMAGAVTANKLDTVNAVITGTAQIADTIITTAKIIDGSITTAKIIDGSITNAKIDRASVNKLQVVTADIANLAVTTGKIANLAVDTFQIAGNAVTISSGGYTAGDTVSVTLLCDGVTPVYINCNTTYVNEAADYNYPLISLIVNGTTIKFLGSGGGILSNNSLIYSYIPSAGVNTFTCVGGGSYVYGTNTSIIVIGLKK